MNPHLILVEASRTPRGILRTPHLVTRTPIFVTNTPFLLFIHFILLLVHFVFITYTFCFCCAYISLICMRVNFRTFFLMKFNCEKKMKTLFSISQISIFYFFYFFQFFSSFKSQKYSIIMFMNASFITKTYFILKDLLFIFNNHVEIQNYVIVKQRMKKNLKTKKIIKIYFRCDRRKRSKKIVHERK